MIGGAQKDSVTPFNHSVELYELANTPKKHITFKDRRHMELYDTKDWVNEVCNFAEKGLGKIKKQKLFNNMIKLFYYVILIYSFANTLILFISRRCYKNE